MEPLFEVIDAGNGKFIKAWKRGVQFEDQALQQLMNTAKLPFIKGWVAAMPDTHWGIGATVGSVVPTLGAICPAAVGVDIGCGMMAARLPVKKLDLGDLSVLRQRIEKAIPAGRTNNGGPGDRGAWHNVPEHIQQLWDLRFRLTYEELCQAHPGMKSKNTTNQLSTLGTGNHFIELTTDENNQVWAVLHSGSRGMGNRIGTYFTQLAKKLCEVWFIELPDKNLAYLPQGTPEFRDYTRALELAQNFAWVNRELMMRALLDAISSGLQRIEVVHCHHNYMAWESHHGHNLMITRKGAVRARVDDLGIIPGSMGARSYIVRGLGSSHSFQSCSHGAGRAMSRTEAKRRFTVAEHAAATEGVECDKSAGTLDETPAAYKPIDAVMAAQADLVEPIHTLKQFLCVKGLSD